MQWSAKSWSSKRVKKKDMHQAWSVLQANTKKQKLVVFNFCPDRSCKSLEFCRMMRLSITSLPEFSRDYFFAYVEPQFGMFHEVGPGRYFIYRPPRHKITIFFLCLRVELESEILHDDAELISPSTWIYLGFLSTFNIADRGLFQGCWPGLHLKCRPAQA